jgi:CRP-like cAMP-binding protein/HAMP domain-containing protein
MASIRKVLPTILVLQISLSMAAIGWISFTSAKKTVYELIAKLSWQVTEHIHNQVMAYLDPSEMSHQLNQIAIDNQNLTLNNFDNLVTYFWRIVIQDSVFERKNDSAQNTLVNNAENPQFDNVTGNLLASVEYIMFGNERGEFIGVENQDNTQITLRIKTSANSPRITYQLNDQGQRVREITREDYDPRRRPWYQAAKQARRLTWSPIYTSSYDQTSLRINPVLPVYDDKGSLLGVFGIEMTLRQISDFLSNLDIGQNGKAFIIESSGKLVATSANEILSISTPEGSQRLNASESSDPLIQATMKKLIADNMMQGITTQTQFELKIDGDYQFIQVKPLVHPHLDWTIIVVIPEADFMGNVYANLQMTLLLYLLVLGIAVLLGISTAQWILKPVGILNQAAGEIESENLNPETLTSVSHRQDELGSLARVFAEMSDNIYARQQNFKRQMEQLNQETNLKKKANILINLGQVDYLNKLLKKSKTIRGKSESYQHLNLPDLLKSVKFFNKFSDRDIQELINIGYKTTLGEGEYVCREDEPGDAFYIILDGAVEIYVEKINKFLTNLSPGAFFGELSLLLGIPRTATVRTTEETILFVVDRNGLQKLLQTYQELADQIAAELHNHKAELDERKEMLKKWGLLDENDRSFSENPLSWIRQLMTVRFGV